MQKIQYTTYYEYGNHEGLAIKAQKIVQGFLVNPEFAMKKNIEATSMNVDWFSYEGGFEWKQPFIYENPENAGDAAAFVPEGGILVRKTWRCTADEAAQKLIELKCEGIFSPHKPIPPHTQASTSEE